MMNLERIKRINYLENTVLLFRGVSEMHGLWLRSRDWGDARRDPQTLGNYFSEFAGELEKNASIKKDGNNVTVDWRYQNTLKDFFRFLEDDSLALNARIQDNAVSERAAKLLCLYDCVESIGEYLPSSKTNVYVPYLFERLCNSMREIAQSDMCYLMHFRDGSFTAIAASSYARKLMDYVLDESDCLEIHNHWMRRGKSGLSDEVEAASVGGTVFRTQIYKKSAREDKNCRFSILALRLEASASEEKEQFYIIFQDLDETGKEWPLWEDLPPVKSSEVTNEDLKNMRDILFLRAKLVKLTQESLHILMLSQTTYRYVIPLGEENKLNILHLTDLHIKTKDRAALEKIFQSFPMQTPDGKQYDIVAITGDIVQGQGSAGELEEHYLLADELLRQLACRLWGYEREEYLRGDWKKRLVIIPGNHDYASMNELEVISQKGARSTGTGRPAQKEGGAMVKFAYYIHFIQRLLGIDAGEQIRDWLNSVRYYDQMSLCLLCLNTSAGAGPLRNNKVHIDPEYIDKLKKTGHFGGYTTICLAHHTFKYEPDYAVDRYYIPSSGMEKLKEYVGEFREILRLDETEPADNMKERLDRLGEKLAADKIDAEEALMADLSYYKKNFRSRDNERCESIRSAMRRDDNMQKADRHNQEEAVKSIEETANIAITLGGHIHEARSVEKSNSYEGPRFYRNDGDVEYAVLRVDLTAETYDWVHYIWSPKSGAPTERPSTSRHKIPIREKNEGGCKS